MRIAKAEYCGNPNIGLFGLATDKALIAARPFKEEGFLGAKIVRARISGTELWGILASGNSNGIVLPSIITKRELDILNKGLEGTGLNTAVINSRETALGNLIVANDRGALISPLLAPHKKKIEEALGVEAVTGTLMGYDIVGSYCCATNKGFLLSMNALREDFDLVKSALKTDGDIGTVNFGSPFVSSGLLANSNAVLCGAQTTGPEVDRIDESLGGFIAEKR